MSFVKLSIFGTSFEASPSQIPSTMFIALTHLCRSPLDMLTSNLLEWVRDPIAAFSLSF